MVKGIHLTLLIGPAIPIPAPKVVVDSLTSVQVNSGGERGGFQLTFSVGKTSPLLNTMLPAGYFDPMITRVVIIVTLNGVPNVIMDGIVTRQEFAPSNDPGHSTLTITGEDLSVLMNIVEMPFMRFPGMPAIARVYLILSKYLAFGIVPLAIPPFINTTPSPTNRIPAQQGTDLDYIRLLASRHGYVFYVEPGPLPGQSIAYWGPDIRIPVPQPALSINMDAHTNIESISFTLDGLAKKIVVLTVFDPITEKIAVVVPLPNINIFQPPLGLRLTPPAKVEFPSWGSTEELPDIVNRALGVLTGSGHAVTASGALDVLRYGHILRARMLVGVRGAGLAYDGLYYVNTVTHNIKQGEYKQNFQLSRDGLVSNTPKLPV